MRHTIKYLCCILLIVMVCAWTYGPVLHGGFVKWDDEQNFLTNYAYRGIGLPQLSWAFSASRIGVYQPLSWLLLGAEYQWGKLDPFYYHLVSLLLHTANSMLLFFLAMAVLRRLPAPWGRAQPDNAAFFGCVTAALFFAAHPLRAEVVAWASCQPYLPCAFFFLVSLIVYVKIKSATPAQATATDGTACCPPPPSPPRLYWWCCLLWASGLCAMLAKAAAISLPVVLPLVDRMLPAGQGKSWRELFADRHKLPLYLCSAAIAATALWAREKIEQTPYALNPSGVERLLQAFHALALYLVKTVWPVDISPHYARPEPLAITQPTVAISLMVVLMVALSLWFLRHRFAAALWSVLASLIVLLPNLGFIQISSSAAADRYTYLASMLPCAVFAACPAAAARRLRGARVALLALALIGLGNLAAAGRRESRIWHDSLALWQHALLHGGEDQEIVRNNLGQALLKNHQNEEAAVQFSAAVAINPHYSLGHANLGVILLGQKHYDKAERAFQEALRWNPRSPRILMDLAAVAFAKGDFENAEARASEVLRLEPKDPRALELSARLRVARRDIPGAARIIAEALAVNPDDASLANAQGLIFLLSGRVSEAAPAFERALQLDPELEEAWLNLGDARMEQGRSDEAIVLYQTYIQRSGSTEPALFGLGRALQAKGRLDEALTVYGTLLIKNPAHIMARQNTALALSALGRHDEALEQLREALRRAPASREVQEDMIHVLRAAGK